MAHVCRRGLRRASASARTDDTFHSRRRGQVLTRARLAIICLADAMRAVLLHACFFSVKAFDAIFKVVKTDRVAYSRRHVLPAKASIVTGIGKLSRSAANNLAAMPTTRKSCCRLHKVAVRVRDRSYRVEVCAHAGCFFANAFEISPRSRVAVNAILLPYLFCSEISFFSLFIRFIGPSCAFLQCVFV